MAQVCLTNKNALQLPRPKDLVYYHSRSVPSGDTAYFEATVVGSTNESFGKRSEESYSEAGKTLDVLDLGRDHWI